MIATKTPTRSALERRRNGKTVRMKSLWRPQKAPIAVIDIGSNSGRVVVMQMLRGGHLEILADARAPLRLARELDEKGRLSRAAMDRTVAALRDFRAIARGNGASRILAVATSAVRESTNSRALIDRVRHELGMRIKIISGEREAQCAFLGAVYGLPVQHGLLLDLGGGSLEVTHFRDRQLKRSWTLPLGALRLSDRMLEDDPPSRSQLRRLRAHITKILKKAEVPALAHDESCIGTGGTVRNMAEIDRRARLYPIPRLHGFVLGLRTVRDLTNLVSGMPMASRAAISGLSKDRADSIVGGFLAIHTTMQFVGAKELQVSGQGLREGLMLATVADRPPDDRVVRQCSIAALTQRFRVWTQEVADRRVEIAERLMGMLAPDTTPEIRETLLHAAAVLDIGRSVDYYDRHRHAARILASAGLNGFSHRGIALLSAVLYQADNGDVRLKSYKPLLTAKDARPILGAAVVLALADELERRSPRTRAVSVGCDVADQEIVLHAEALLAWRPRALGERFRRAFGRDLRLAP